MKLILTQPEIEQIIRNHINESITLSSGNDFTIDFVATRGDQGVTATIDVPYMGVSELSEVQTPSAKTPATAAKVTRAPKTTASTPTPDAPGPSPEEDLAAAAQAEAEASAAQAEVEGPAEDMATPPNDNSKSLFQD